jgi:cyanate permease
LNQDWRINAVAASVTAWMSAAGPLFSGLVLNAGGSYRLVGWLAALSYALVFAFAYRPSRAAESGLRNQ